LCVAKYLPFRGTAVRWIISDVVLVLVVCTAQRWDSAVGISALAVVAAGAVLATALDYIMDWHFYFPADGIVEAG
jgi:hypothetical protein